MCCSAGWAGSTSFPGDMGAAHTLGRVLGRVIEPLAAARIAARFAPLRGMLYFCMLGYVLGAPDQMAEEFFPLRTVRPGG